MLVDSHCHLNYPEFKGDLDKVIQHAKNEGIQTFLTISTKLEEVKEIQQIADTYDEVFCTVGVHPHEADKYNLDNLYNSIIDLAKHPKVKGIGETGLDFYYNHSPAPQQIEAFNIHIQASIDLNLPLVIHTREADADTLNCLKKHPKAYGVFHCFSGSQELAKAALDLGFYISFSGILTFKKAEDLREIAKFVPLDKILVETDAPFLAPLPHRGQRNEPAFTKLTALKLAEIKNLSFEEVAFQTTRNFNQLFLKIN